MFVALWVLVGCGRLLSIGGGACDLGPPETCFAKGQEHLRGQAPQFDVAAAAQRFGQACDDGHLHACVSLGLQLQDGRGVPQDIPKAMASYQRACDGGTSVGCLNLAFQYQTGTGVVIDEEKAREYFVLALEGFRVSCDGATPTFCSNLGYVLEHGFGASLPDIGGARDAYRHGCEGGDKDACVSQALLDLEQGQGEPGASVALLQTTCDGGFGLACGALGQLYDRDQYGIPRDLEKALPLLDKGCELGDGQACGVLGAVLVKVGDGSQAVMDRVDAAERRACVLGRGLGCLVVAEAALSAHRAGVSGATDVAAEYFAAACRIGEREACSLFGAMVMAGDLGPPEPEVAFRAYGEACQRLDMGACVELLRAGRPLPLSENTRTEFLAEACRRGIGEGCAAGDVSPGDPPGTAPSP